MKLQFEDQSIRLRISELEFADLQSGQPIGVDFNLGSSSSIKLRVVPASIEHGAAGDRRWQVLADSNAGTELVLQVDQNELAEYATRLPCREGMLWQVTSACSRTLEIELAVDIRDSIGKRGHRRDKH